MIEFKQVSKSFGSKVVLDRVSFRIQRGEIYFVIGRSGVGKSVLLKHIVGLLQPDEGEIWVDGQEVTHLEEEQFQGIRKVCGMVFQHPALFDSLTVFENIAFGLRTHRLVENEAALKTTILEKLKLVNLNESVLDRFPQELSFGIQKRISIVRALVLQPNNLLFDEPTTAQDPVMTNSINRLILNLSRSLGVTSLVVSHDMHCAIEIAHRILLLDEGRVMAEGTPEAMLNSAEPIVQKFMEEAKERMHVPDSY